MRAKIDIFLSDAMHFGCFEHLLFGTPFNDQYDWFFSKGQKTLPFIDFTTKEEVADLLQNGISIFTFCGRDNAFYTSSLVETATMFFGGEGSSKYVPMVGTTVPEY